MAGGFAVRWLAVLLVVALVGGVASAAATNWQSVGMGDWFLGTNWDGGGPTGGITAAVGNGATVQVDAGSANALSLEIGAALENTSSGTVTVAGGSLTAPSLYVGTATSTTDGVTATGTGLLQMSDAVFSAPTLLQIGVSSATHGGSTAVSTGQATLTGGTAAIGDLQVGNAVGRGDHAADGILRFEDVEFTGTGSWTIGNAVRTAGGGGTVAVNRAEVVIEGDDASTANLISLSIGNAGANRGSASTNASFSFTGQSVTAGSLSVGAASAGEDGGSAHVHEASATFDADLIVTGNANVGTGHSESSAGIENAGLTIAPGRRFEVAGGLTIGNGGVGGSTGKLSIASPAVTLGDGADLSVGGLLTIGQVHGGSHSWATVEDAHLTQQGGSAALNGGLVVGRATIGRDTDVSVSGRLSLDGTTLTAGGAWVIGDASVSSYSGGAATVVSTADVMIAGDAASAVDLTSVIVGNVRSDDDYGTASVIADLALSGGTASVGGLQVGTAAASSRAGVTADASARFEDMTFTGTGEWTIGRATKGGDVPVGAATVSQAVLTIEGDDASTADLSGLNIGTASAGDGTAQVGDTQFSFTGRSVTTTTLPLGTATSGDHGTARVNGASAAFDADLTVTDNASIGVGVTGGERGSVTIQNVGLTVDEGHAFYVGGALTVGSGAGSRTVNITGPAVTLREGVDFGVGGSLTIGQTSGGWTSSSSVDGAHLTLEGGSASLHGGLVVGHATGSDYVGDARTISPRLWLDETNFSGLGAWTIGKAITPTDSHSDAVVENAEVRILGDAASNADLTSVVVGQAHSQGTGSARATGSLTYRGGSFHSSDGMLVGSAQAEDPTNPVQATGSATFINTNASVRSLRVARYTGVGEQNPSSFAHGSLTLADSIMTVDENAEFARLTGGVGSATSELSLTRSLLDVEGDLLLDDGSELLFQIDGYDEFGRIEAGTASLDGDLTVAFDFILTGIGTWDLITLDDDSSFVGDFDGTAVLGLSAGTAWSLGFATNDYGQAVYRLAVTDVPIDPLAVPAPGAIGLLCVGLGIVLRRRR